MRTLIVTDVTRFKDPEHVCVAGITPDGTTCIRPMKSRSLCSNNPYLEHGECASYGIYPGVTIEGNFRPVSGLTRPHTEDHHYDQLRVVHGADTAALINVLRMSASNSLADAFNAPIADKFFPIDGPLPTRSIITLRVHPESIDLTYSYNKLRISFAERVGNRRSRIAITDLGLQNFIEQSDQPELVVNQLNNAIQRQAEVFLRIGIGRTAFEAEDGRKGLWLQVNGIYSHPDFFNEFRNYYL